MAEKTKSESTWSFLYFKNEISRNGVAIGKGVVYDAILQKTHSPSVLAHSTTAEQSESHLLSQPSGRLGAAAQITPRS